LSRVPVVEVAPLTEWAILPSKPQVDRRGPREESALLERSFRYHRRFRYPEACPPWVMGQELGWRIASPVTVTLTPLDDVQVAAGEDPDPREAARLLGREDFWRRSTGYIATSRNDWLRVFQYLCADGAWEGMFLPNGSGSVEWRLGWRIRIPADAFLLVTSLDESPGMTVPTGVLTAKQTNRTWDGGGFSIAVRPDRTVTVHRGQPIARLVLLGRESLQATLGRAQEGQENR
jgi:hypothetical protein